MSSKQTKRTMNKRKSKKSGSVVLVETRTKPTISKKSNRNVKDELLDFMANVDSRKPAESAGEILGRKLGMFAGRLLGKITGTGDYTTNLPPGGLPIEESAVPQFIKTENSRETRIRHREFVGNIFASTTAGEFKIESFGLNPGNDSLFPWLAGIAQHYDEWEPHGAVVIFKTLTSTYAASQSLGTVIIASDYDVYDPTYTTKVEMANSEFAVSGNAAQNLMHPIECAVNERLTRVLTVKSGPLSLVDNKRFFDLANVQIASEGCLANQLLGELWVTYDFSFYKPQLPLNPGGLGIVHQMFTTTMSDRAAPFEGIISISPTGTSDLIAGLGVNYIRFADRYVGYYFLISIRGYAADVDTSHSFNLIGCSEPTDNRVWTLGTNLTGQPVVVNTPVVLQTIIRIDPATDGIHVFSVLDMVRLQQGPENRYSAAVSIEQINPKTLNFQDWAGLP